MKLKGFKLEEHPILGNLDLDFKDKEGNILNTIVFAGSNGSGKTNLLNEIYKFLETSVLSVEEGKQIYFKGLENSNIDNTSFLEMLKNQGYKLNKIKNNEIIFKNLKDTNFKEKLSKVIYIPTEINFDNLKTKTNTLELKYQFSNKIDKQSIEDIPSYIATRIYSLANIEEDMSMKNIRSIIAKEINDIFKILELDIQFIGLTRDERSLPLFKNKSNIEFDINGLSSGEKQLFLRALTIKMLNANNSIILIDEPEISLHPKWQQKILKVYENIGENNQIIVATHSPHIISSTHSKNLRLMKRTEVKIEIISGNELNEIYGKPVDRTLLDVMELESVRTPTIEKKLCVLRDLVDEEKYETEEFIEKYRELENLLGSTDEDLMLIRLDINIKKRG